MVFLLLHAQGTSSSFNAQAKAGCCSILCLGCSKLCSQKGQGRPSFTEERECTLKLCPNSENNVSLLLVLRLTYKVTSFIMASSYTCVIFCFLPLPHALYHAFFLFQLIPSLPSHHPVSLPFYFLITCVPAPDLFHAFLELTSFPLMILFLVL